MYSLCNTPVIRMPRKKTVTSPRYAAAFRFIALSLIYMCAVLGKTGAVQATEVEPYRIQPGDVLIVSVWKETDLQSEVLVRPDGGLSLPLVGDLQAAGKSVEDVRKAVDERLRKFIPDPVVTIAVKQINGNRVYVLGKVNRPGDFPLSQPIDVMQALSLAGGTTPFAALDDIQILRREHGRQTSLRFKYGEVEKGRHLEQNVLLRSGDTVVVP